MKRLFTLIAAISVLFTTMAQYPMVTLSHNGELSFFNDPYAINSAINVAENGDTLYLSEGVFIIAGGALTIKKRVSIVGNGYGTHILGNVYMNMYDNPNSEMNAPLFDGVRLDELVFLVSNSDSSSRISKQNFGVSEIRRCWINKLWDAGYAGTEVTIDKCFINQAQFRGSNDDVIVKNSKFLLIDEGGYRFKGAAINCNISSKADYYPTTMISCIFESGREPSRDGYHSILNSVLDFTPSVYTQDCYIYNDEDQPLLDENLNCLLNLEELGYLGHDGTVVGIYGGDFPFSENPSMPTVDTTKSTVEYDSENNKLKVSITMKAD